MRPIAKMIFKPRSQFLQSPTLSSQDFVSEKVDAGRLRRPLWKKQRLWLPMLITGTVFALAVGFSLGLTRDHKCNATCSRKYPIVDLGYAKYQGTTFPGGIRQFVGMRYAAPPVGELRFAAPQDPLTEKRIIKANKVRYPGSRSFCHVHLLTHFCSKCRIVFQRSQNTRKRHSSRPRQRTVFS